LLSRGFYLEFSNNPKSFIAKVLIDASFSRVVRRHLLELFLTLSISNLRGILSDR